MGNSIANVYALSLSQLVQYNLFLRGSIFLHLPANSLYCTHEIDSLHHRKVTFLCTYLTIPKHSMKFNWFDKILVGGLIIGVLILCGIVGLFIFSWTNRDVVLIPTISTANPVPTPDLIASPTFLPSPNATTAFPPEEPRPQLPSATAIPPSPTPTSPSPTYQNPPIGKLVYTCYHPDNHQICLMNADGSASQKLTDMSAIAFYASLSPNGNTIVFSSRTEQYVFEIYSMTTDGKNLTKLTNAIGNLFAPEISPDGQSIVFTNATGGSQNIWVMDIDGENPRALTAEPIDDIDPTWSPDGRMIAFASSRQGERQLFVMDADGSNIRQVTNLPNMGGRSSWSPDGTRLAFYAGPSGDHDIYTIEIDGTDLRQLTDGGDNLGPSWSLDGEWIAFTSWRDRDNEIYLTRPDGSETRRLTSRTLDDWQPRWGR